MAEKGVKSARGERVDFNLIKIKQQMASAPKTVTVKAREDFIDQKFKRRLARQTREIVSTITAAEVPTEKLEDMDEVTDESTIVENPIVLEQTDIPTKKVK